jgi:hypothetical protein
MMDLSAFLLALAGFAALALAMHRHQRHVFHRALGRGADLLLRSLGVAGLAASFAASVASTGWVIGPVLWFGWLTAAALTVALALTWWPQARTPAKKPAPHAA